MALKVPSNGLKAIAKAKYEAEQAAKAAKAHADALAFAATLAGAK
jgi:hypothetical protein